MRREQTSSAIKILESSVVVLLLALATGCQTRSISDSRYPGDRRGAMFANRGDGSPYYEYHGELNEFDVLGIERDQSVSEQQISTALDNARPVRVPKGSSVLLIQSGARFPDDGMIQELSRYYNVNAFPGVPESNGGASYAKTLRLAAARGKNQAIICYWGILETAQKDLATKRISWVPVVGWNLPDEKQQMRIRLKMAVIDVRTGNWAMFYPKPFEDTAISNLMGRRNSDQQQVHVLKEKAYTTAAQDLVKGYATN